MGNCFLKRILALSLVLAMAVSVSGCGQEKEKVYLSIWCSENKVELVTAAIEEFIKVNSEEADIDYKISKEEEDTCKETVLSNPEGAADLYSFADDQLDELIDAGALLEIDADPVRELRSFGGEGSTAYQSCVRDGVLYAYPQTVNGYFLYYNKKYLDKTDVGSLERIIEIAGNDNKKFAMDFSSGWYLYSFFQGADFNLEYDKATQKNKCDWNRKTGPYTGLEMAKTLSRIAVSRGFKSMTDDEFVEGVENGTVIAGVNGAWNSEKIKAAWGDDYAAAKLPTFMIGKGIEQMASFTGYKVIGINSATKYPGWCRRFIQFFLSKENQIKEFIQTGEVPANIEIADMEEVKDSPAVIALNEQAPYATLQRVGGAYWDASSKFGAAIASGNPDKLDYQELLNKMVEGITK
ncbi:MAG: extracellular solute-binding protein [Eubacterium sp.]|nr:extracellular solute-binding protein [Eubacterium sp.]